jgi:hypothetical protein
MNKEGNEGRNKVRQDSKNRRETCVGGSLNYRHLTSLFVFCLGSNLRLEVNVLWLEQSL